MTGRGPLHRELTGATGPVVVLLHEGAGSSRDWDSLAPKIRTADRRVLAYDRRGFGRSPRDTDYGPDLFADDVTDLADLLDDLGLDRVHLVGHSDGGTVALLAAARLADRVASVTVVATHIRPDPATVAAVRDLGPPTAWPESMSHLYARKHGSDWERVVTAWLRFWTEDTTTRWDLTPELPAVEAPLLVVHDRHDPLSPSLHAEEIAAAHPEARISWYDTGNHRPHLRDRPRFLDELNTQLEAASVT